MSESKLTAELVQHTPLIHFQHDHPGAGLRATEVKPMLDRYLREQEPIPKEWVIALEANDNKALNYRLRVAAPAMQAIEIEQDRSRKGSPLPFPTYFGNMGDGKVPSRFLFAQDGWQIHIQCFVPELMKALRRHLGPFFARHNFMNRKTKGFGSFTVARLNGKPIDGRPTAPYHFSLACGDKPLWKEWKNLSESIDYFYRTLRSGINLKGPGFSDMLYFKSLLFQYAKTQNHQWDKRKMRRDLFLYDRKYQEVERKRTEPEGTVQYQKGEPRLYRDMLGLASETDWMSYNKAKVKKKDLDKLVDRYPSPITFKPIHEGDGHYTVYLLTRSADPLMNDRQFIIQSGGKTSELTTPEAFDLEDYLSFAFTFFGREPDEIEQKLEDYLGRYEARRIGWIVDLIEHIYRQLAKQVPA